jgi:hypothetical protein
MNQSSPSNTLAEYIPRGGETPAWKRACDRRDEARHDAALLIQKAVAAGTHTTRPSHFCADCRRWVSEIWFADRHKSLCPICATRAGLGVPGITLEELLKKETGPAAQGSPPPPGGTDAPQGRGAATEGGFYSSQPRAPRVVPTQSFELQEVT